jgi:ubiquinone biosynthesis protein Coq4
LPADIADDPSNPRCLPTTPGGASWHWWSANEQYKVEHVQPIADGQNGVVDTIYGANGLGGGMANAATNSSECANGYDVVPDKRKWLTAFRCARLAVRTKNYGEPVYEAFLAMLAPLAARAYYKFRAHPNGRRLLRDRPDLLVALRDKEYLSSLPAGTLGHAYQCFMTTNQLHPGLYDDNEVIRPIVEKNHWNEDFYYLLRRGSAIHDLFHVIGGYGPDVAGEAANIGFHYGQLEGARVFLFWGWYLSLMYPGASLRRKFRYFRQAVERGRRADLLMAAPWEELLDKPIDEVREILGVAPAHIAHPQGQLYTAWAPSGNPPATRWDYEAILAGG